MERGKAVVYWTQRFSLGKRVGFLVFLRISLRSPSSGSHYGEAKRHAGRVMATKRNDSVL